MRTKQKNKRVVSTVVAVLGFGAAALLVGAGPLPTILKPTGKVDAQSPYPGDVGPNAGEAGFNPCLLDQGGNREVVYQDHVIRYFQFGGEELKKVGDPRFAEFDPNSEENVTAYAHLFEHTMLEGELQNSDPATGHDFWAKTAWCVGGDMDDDGNITWREAEWVNGGKPLYYQAGKAYWILFENDDVIVGILEDCHNLIIIEKVSTPPPPPCDCSPPQPPAPPEVTTPPPGENPTTTVPGESTTTTEPPCDCPPETTTTTSTTVPDTTTTTTSTTVPEETTTTTTPREPGKTSVPVTTRPPDTTAPPHTTTAQVNPPTQTAPPDTLPPGITPSTYAPDPSVVPYVPPGGTQTTVPIPTVAQTTPPPPSSLVTNTAPAAPPP